MVRILLSVIIALLSGGITVSAIDTLPKTAGANIKTVAIRNADAFMGVPLIRLGTDDKLTLSFDIIGDSHEYLRYRIIHCNADWQPSQLLESEYLDGFNEMALEDFAYSSNTFVHYVNYKITLPDTELGILASGNYLIQVYREDDPDDVILQERFTVSEDTAAVKSAVTSRTDRGFNTKWQQLLIDVDIASTPVRDPFNDMLVTVTQNNRPETVRILRHPSKTGMGHAIYEHDPALIFPAGNEYRRFETVRSDYPGMHIDSVVFGGTNWHAYLAADTPRVGKNHSFDRTQHGRFMIDEYSASDPDLGADYVTVHFTLDSPEIIGGDVYIDGDFTGHRFDDSNRMVFDYNTRQYSLQLPLKQGSYNYQYAVLPSGYDSSSPSALPNADVSVIEGDFYETDNEYLILVYARPPGARADRLIGHHLITLLP